MSYIQLPYGYVENNKQVQFNIPKNIKNLFISTKLLILMQLSDMMKILLMQLLDIHWI